MIGCLILSLLLIILALVVMVGFNIISLSAFVLLTVAISLLFGFTLTRYLKKRKLKKSKAAQAEVPEETPATKTEPPAAEAPESHPSFFSLRKMKEDNAEAATEVMGESPAEAAEPASQEAPALEPLAGNPEAIRDWSVENTEDTPQEAVATEMVSEEVAEPAVLDGEPELPAEESVSEPEAEFAGAEPSASSLSVEKTAAPVSADISQRFSQLRTQWFAAMAKKLAAAGKRSDGAKKLTVTQADLGGDADIALKALQIYTVDRYLNRYNYLTPAASQDFRKKLVSQVFAGQQSGCAAYLNTLLKTAGQDPAQVLPFVARSVAFYCTANSAPTAAAALVETSLTALVDEITLESARALGDKRTVTKLVNQIAAAKTKPVVKKSKKA